MFMKAYNSSYDETKQILTEAVELVRTQTNTDLRLQPLKSILDPNVFDSYIAGLADGLNEQESMLFEHASKEARVYMLNEAQVSGDIAPIQTVIFPVLRVFFPKLVAKELVTVVPQTMPNQIKTFVKVFLYNPLTGEEVEAPYYDVERASGAQLDPNKELDSSVPGVSINGVTATIDLKKAIAASIYDPTSEPEKYNALITDRDFIESPLARQIVLTGVTYEYQDGSTTATDTVECNIVSDIRGNLYGELTPNVGSVSGLTIFGNIDYSTGQAKLVLAGNGVVSIKSIKAQATLSTELSIGSNQIKFKFVNIELNAILKELNAKWTIETEQDTASIYNFDMQVNMASTLGAQLAVERDLNVINELLRIAKLQDGGSFKYKIYANARARYLLTDTEWSRQSISIINRISQEIMTGTRIAPGNIIAMNNIDFGLIKNLNTFSFVPDKVDSGSLRGHAYQTGTLADEYRIVSSPIIPQGSALLLLKSNDEKEACFVMGEYKSLYTYRYTKDSVPALAFKTRFSKAVIRPEGIRGFGVDSSSAPADLDNVKML